jgi:exodeoxyribonuclease V gamma subunit
MFLLQRRLGLRLEDELQLTAERENFELDPLQRHLVEQDLFQTLIEGNTPEAFKPIQKAIGQLPHGNVGEYLYRAMSIEAQHFVNRMVKFTGTKSSTPIKVDLEIGGFHLDGRLTTVSDSGYVHVRYARQRNKDLLRTWIYHLVYCHVAPTDFQRSSYLICKDSAVRFEPVSDSVLILEDLLALFRQGLETPLHFFPNSSYEYAEQLLRKSAPESTALSRAARIWVGNDFSKYNRGESNDPYYSLCFRHSSPLDTDFQINAVKIFKPLLDKSRDIQI